MITASLQDHVVQVEPTDLCAAAPLCAVERVEIVQSADYLTLHATKAIDPLDPYMPGHFPGFTIFPGVFIIEAVNQAVAIGLRESFGLVATIDSVVSVRFLAPLLAGDRLALEISVGPISVHGPFNVDAVCRRRDGVVAARLKMRVRCGARDRDRD